MAGHLAGVVSLQAASYASGGLGTGSAKCRKYYQAAVRRPSSRGSAVSVCCVDRPAGLYSRSVLRLVVTASLYTFRCGYRTYEAGFPATGNARTGPGNQRYEGTKPFHFSSVVESCEKAALILLCQKTDQPSRSPLAHRRRGSR